MAKIEANDACMIREPIFPFKRLFNINGKEVNTKSLGELIPLFINDTFFMEALYWSSITLYEEVNKYKNNNLSEKKKIKIEQSLLKYILRSSTRATPFDLFAGVYMSHISQNIEINNSKSSIERKLIRHTRVDTAFLLHLLKDICGDPAYQKKMTFTLNNTIYKYGTFIRYIEEIRKNNGKIDYEVSAIANSSFFKTFLASFKCKYFDYQQLKEFLCNNELLSTEEIDEIFAILINNNLIIPEIYTQLTNHNDFERIVHLCKNYFSEKTDILDKINELLEVLDKKEINVIQFNIATYCMQALNKVTKGYDASSQKMQNDLEISYSSSHVSKETIDSIQNAVDTLYLYHTQQKREDPWKKFKERFEERYGTEEIELTKMLDPDTGIGFPVISSIGSNAREYFNTKSIDRTPTFIKEKLEQIPFYDCSTSLPIINLSSNKSDAEIPNINNKDVCFSVFASLYPNGKIVVHSIGGSNAAALIGRFGYINEECRNYYQTIVKKDMASYGIEAIFAEIVHLPGATRLGNIARRIVFTDYEIPILSPSSKNWEYQIHLNDLKVSIRNGKIILRSKRLNKIVIPRLSNAHNYVKSDIPAYRFLCALAQQDSFPSLGINWNNNFDNYSFLPRIETNNVILSRAEWRIGKEIQDRILGTTNPLQELIDYLDKQKVPRFFQILQGDNELFIDKENDSFLALLLNEFGKERIIRICEWPESITSNDFECEYVRQLVIPMTYSSNKSENTPPFIIQPPKSNNIQRSFAPGSEWLYFKVYLSSNNADEVLCLHLFPLLQKLEENNDICQFFFIRYKDPHFHIRLRLKLKKHFSVQELSIVIIKMNKLLEKLKKNQLLWKWEIDTYERELERYGTECIEQTENAFHNDSKTVLYLLRKWLKEEKTYSRIYTGYLLIDQWCNLFLLNNSDKIKFCDQRINYFVKEFGELSKYECEIDIRKENWLKGLSQYLEINFRMKKNEISIDSRKLRKENLADYIHMSLNRWNKDDLRLEEFRTFILAKKYYSIIKYSKKNNESISR